MKATCIDRVRDILATRADRELAARRLVVDYYRIRQKIAYPIPLRDMGFMQFDARDITGLYPWETWLSWRHEERVAALGWAVELLGNDACREPVIAELRAVAGWRRYGHHAINGLGMAHFSRTMYRAWQNWDWLDDETVAQLRAGCEAMLACYQDYLKAEQGAWDEHQGGPDAPTYPFRNIHFIGTVGLGLAARLCDHPRREWLESHVARFIRAIFDQQAAGDTEAVCYDGYMLDFMVDWLPLADPGVREDLLAHPALAEMMRQSWTLAVPGEGMNVARLGDVEPVEMPFHASALVRVRGLIQEPAIDAYLRGCNPERLRCDGLAGLIQQPPAPTATLPNEHRSRAALVLRSGHDRDDLAVAMSCHQLQAGHLHNDNGSLVIGTAGAWLIDDPGYQQYLKTSERAFTTEGTAHNGPLINRMSAMHRQGKVLQEPVQLSPDLSYMAVDTTACYLNGADCQRVERHVWLMGQQAVWVADRLAVQRPAHIRYQWHGHPDAAWFAEEGMALVSLGDGLLWIRDFQQPLNTSMITRLRGSRGHLTLQSEHAMQGERVLWWAFGARDCLAAAIVEDDCLYVGSHDLSPA